MLLFLIVLNWYVLGFVVVFGNLCLFRMKVGSKRNWKVVNEKFVVYIIVLLLLLLMLILLVEKGIFRYLLNLGDYLSFGWFINMFVILYYGSGYCLRDNVSVGFELCFIGYFV